MSRINDNFKEKSRLRRENARAQNFRTPNSNPGRTGGARTSPLSGASNAAPSANTGSKLGRGLKTVGKGLRAASVPGAILTAAAPAVSFAENRRYEQVGENMERMFEENRDGGGEGFEFPGGEPVSRDPSSEDLGGPDGFVAPAEEPAWLRRYRDNPEMSPRSATQGSDESARSGGGDSPRARRLREMGVPQEAIDSAPIEKSHRRAVLAPDGRATPGQTLNLGKFGSEDPDGDIFGTADETGRVNSFRGVGSRRTPEQRMAEGRESAARVQRAIPIAQENNRLRRGQAGGGSGGGISDVERTNRAFDRRRQELRNQFEGNSTGSGRAALASAMNQLEADRTNQLNNLRSNATDLRTQGMAGDASRDVATINAQGQTQQERMKQQGLNYRQATENQIKQAANQAEMSETGYKRYRDAIENMFFDEDTGETDPVEADRFANYLETSDVFSPGEFMSMEPQEQQVLKREIQRMFEMNDRFNESTDGMPTESIDRIAAEREAALKNVINGDLSLRDYLSAFNFFGENDPTLVTDSGRERPVSDILRTAEDRRLADRDIEQAPDRQRLRNSQ